MIWVWMQADTRVQAIEEELAKAAAETPPPAKKASRVVTPLVRLGVSGC
jgi:hypothetical protein